MKIGGKHYRTIWIQEGNDRVIQIIDQRWLPHQFVIEDLQTVNDVARAIKDMHVRGAGLIGATVGYGMYLAALESPKNNSFDTSLKSAAQKLKSTRPTAVNLAWAVHRQLDAIGKATSFEEKIRIAKQTADIIADEDAAYCKQIGEHGLKIIEEIREQKEGSVVNILTHCNAGWLAFVDHGSATSPIYAAHIKGIKVHVWVDETRPGNQGARLTAWELGQQGVPHTVIADNVGGLLMQKGKVDLVITGADRVTYTGDAANKIGTYLKALAAKDNHVPFYIALPSSTFDWTMTNGVKEIPIEERAGDEVTHIMGSDEDGKVKKVLLTPAQSKAVNYGFDVTPRNLISGLITERGVCKANQESILQLFPEKKDNIREGVIKFNIDWKKGPELESSQISELQLWRKRLYDRGLIGKYQNGIGFGDISLLDGNGSFIITGTQTGGLNVLGTPHYTRVTSSDITNNKIVCEGPIKASSESLTHAAIYNAHPSVKSVIHIHHKALWEKLQGVMPTSRKEVPYGTVKMAHEIFRLFQETDLLQKKILVMAGHEDGLITFGESLDEAGNLIFKVFEEFKFTTIK